MGKRDKEDEAELWARVTGSAAPLKQRNRVSVSLAPAKPPRLLKKQPPSPQPTPMQSKPAPRPRPTASAVTLDRQTSRQLEKGRLAVEARLDLHGLRQRDALAQLRTFLKSAQARDLRHVLVITGKGGVLHSQLPLWLGQSDMRALVGGINQAHVKHGGAGAFYVLLKRHRRAR